MCLKEEAQAKQEFEEYKHFKHYLFIADFCNNSRFWKAINFFWFDLNKNILESSNILTRSHFSKPLFDDLEALSFSELIELHSDLCVAFSITFPKFNGVIVMARSIVEQIILLSPQILSAANLDANWHYLEN